MVARLTVQLPTGIITYSFDACMNIVNNHRGEYTCQTNVRSMKAIKPIVVTGKEIVIMELPVGKCG